MSNKVSVIIPCYNSEVFIDISIESVWSQDYCPIELIIVDDGSTDQSKERILKWEERFRQKGNVLKYVYQTNRGPGGAIDTGLKHVTGEYLTLLDADDVYLPSAIRKKAEFLDMHPDYAGVRNNGWMVRGTERELFINTDDEKAIDDLFTALSFGRTNNWAGSYMIRTDILFQCYPDRNINPSRFGQNFQILLPVSYKRKFGYIDEPLMEYRVQANSHSRAEDPEEQYRRADKNTDGWRGIYMEILDQIVTDPKEHQFYKSAYDAVFYRSRLHQAARYHKMECLNQYYRLLKGTRYASLNDHIVYYSARDSMAVIPLKILRKLKMWMSRKKK